MHDIFCTLESFFTEELYSEEQGNVTIYVVTQDVKLIFRIGSKSVLSLTGLIYICILSCSILFYVYFQKKTTYKVLETEIHYIIADNKVIGTESI